MTDQNDPITTADAQEVVSRWWFNYDNGNFDVLPSMLTEDTSLRVRSDSGATDFEEFVTASVDGRDDVAAWHVQHRRDSPYPLRHNGTNFHMTGRGPDSLEFASYIYVTQVQDVLPSGLSSAVVTGTIRREGDELRIAAMNIVLDMTTSVTFSDVR